MIIQISSLSSWVLNSYKRLIKELPVTEVRNDCFFAFPDVFDDFLNRREIKVVRIWTNKDVNITPNKMLDDNTYYIFEGGGNHPMLKYRITNYLKDVPFNTAIIYSNFAHKF